MKSEIHVRLRTKCVKLGINKTIGHINKTIGHINKSIQSEELEDTNVTTLCADKDKKTLS